MKIRLRLRIIGEHGHSRKYALELEDGQGLPLGLACPDLGFDHPSVSMAHCYLTVQHQALNVVDNNPAVGTFLNRQRVTTSPVKAGDTLTIGIYSIEFLDIMLLGAPANVEPIRKPSTQIIHVPSRPPAMTSSPARSGQPGISGSAALRQDHYRDDEPLYNEDPLEELDPQTGTFTIPTMTFHSETKSWERTGSEVQVELEVVPEPSRRGGTEVRRFEEPAREDDLTEGGTPRSFEPRIPSRPEGSTRSSQSRSESRRRSGTRSVSKSYPRHTESRRPDRREEFHEDGPRVVEDTPSRPAIDQNDVNSWLMIGISLGLVSSAVLSHRGQLSLAGVSLGLLIGTLLVTGIAGILEVYSKTFRLVGNFREYLRFLSFACLGLVPIRFFLQFSVEVISLFCLGVIGASAYLFVRKFRP